MCGMTDIGHGHRMQAHIGSVLAMMGSGSMAATGTDLMAGLNTTTTGTTTATGTIASIISGSSTRVVSLLQRQQKTGGED
jgi:hypothetical protein